MQILPHAAISQFMSSDKYMFHLVAIGMLRTRSSLRDSAGLSPPKMGRALLTEACTKMRSAWDNSPCQLDSVSLISLSSAACINTYCWL